MVAIAPYVAIAINPRNLNIAMHARWRGILPDFPVNRGQCFRKCSILRFFLLICDFCDTRLFHPIKAPVRDQEFRLNIREEAPGADWTLKLSCRMNLYQTGALPSDTLMIDMLYTTPTPRSLTDADSQQCHQRMKYQTRERAIQWVRDWHRDIQCYSSPFDL